MTKYIFITVSNCLHLHHIRQILSRAIIWHYQIWINGLQEENSLQMKLREFRKCVESKYINIKEGKLEK